MNYQIDMPSLHSESKFCLDIFVCKTTEKNRKELCGKCRRIVDIVYKRVSISVWFPEVKIGMYAQIVIDCQTGKEEVSCEYCIVRRVCRLRLELEYKVKTAEIEDSASGLLLPLLLMRV